MIGIQKLGLFVSRSNHVQRCKQISILIISDNERIAYDFRINGKFAGYTADGMSIDRDGHLWLGMFKGNSVVAVDPV